MDVKKILLLFVIGTYSLSAQNQETEKYGSTIKGNFFVGGASSLNFSTQLNKEKSSNMNLSLRGAKFISNNLALGLSTGYSFREEELFKEQRISVSVILRKYFGTNKLRPFAELGLGFNYDDNKYDPRLDRISYTHFPMNIDFPIGASYFINKSFSIDFEVDPVNILEDSIFSPKFGINVFFK